MLQTTVLDIEGITPLLMNRYTGDEARVEKMEKLSEKEAWDYARQHAYFTPKGKPFIPAANLQQALIAGASFCKGKGRGNLSRLVAAGLQIQEVDIELKCDDPELFRNMRKNPSTGGKMLQYRVKINTPWKAHFTLLWDDELLMRSQVDDVVRAAGIRAGLMDWRPQKRGPYGQFRAVTK